MSPKSIGDSTARPESLIWLNQFPLSPTNSTSPKRHVRKTSQIEGTSIFERLITDVLGDGVPRENVEVCLDSTSVNYRVSVFPVFVNSQIATLLCCATADADSSCNPLELEHLVEDISSVLHVPSRHNQRRSQSVQSERNNTGNNAAESCNALSIIYSSAELLDHFGASWSPEHRREHFDKIRSAVDQLHSLVNLSLPTDF
jgi:hypothetical protein